MNDTVEIFTAVTGWSPEYPMNWNQDGVPSVPPFYMRQHVLPDGKVFYSAKYTGRLGVCLAHLVPVAFILLNGLYDAKLGGQPVLAITGHAFHDLIDTHQQQDVDLDHLFSGVTVYNARIMGPAHVENVANLACRTALNYRGVGHINFPEGLGFGF